MRFEVESRRGIPRFMSLNILMYTLKELQNIPEHGSSTTMLYKLLVGARSWLQVVHVCQLQLLAKSFKSQAAGIFRVSVCFTFLTTIDISSLMSTGIQAHTGRVTEFLRLDPVKHLQQYRVCVRFYGICTKYSSVHLTPPKLPTSCRIETYVLRGAYKEKDPDSAYEFKDRASPA